MGYWNESMNTNFLAYLEKEKIQDSLFEEHTLGKGAVLYDVAELAENILHAAGPKEGVAANGFQAGCVNRDHRGSRAFQDPGIGNHGNFIGRLNGLVILNNVQLWIFGATERDHRDRCGQ